MEGLSVYGAYSQLDATEPAGIEIRRPKEQASLDASWDVLGGPFQINLGVTHVGENIDTDFATFLRAELDPYTLIRLGASWEVNDEFELYTRIENLTDESYQEVIGYNAAPQALYIGLRFRDEASKRASSGAEGHRSLGRSPSRWLPAPRFYLPTPSPSASSR